MQLIGALIVPWWFRGRRREIRQWVDAFLDAAGDAAVGRAAPKCWRYVGLVAEPGIRAGADASDRACTTSCWSPNAVSARRWRSTRPAATSWAIANDCLLLLVTLARQASVGERIDAVEVVALRADVRRRCSSNWATTTGSSVIDGDERHARHRPG